MRPILNEIDVDKRLDLQNRQIGYLSKLKQALITLQLKYDFGKNPFEEINFENIIENIAESPNEFSSPSEYNESDSENSSKARETHNYTSDEAEENESIINDTNSSNKMPQSA